ncbi:MAG TPA: 16S rRNA processing protein RimM [Clostridia bacterium]|jgi:16S rRNA processing protein RimM|nr:16S rRNA processing protein RimM [Clostridia bacterium]
MVDYIKIGQIVNTHGRLGELKIYPLTDNPLRFKELKTVFIDENSYPIIKVRLYRQMVLLHLEGITDLHTAQKLKGKYVTLPRSKLKQLPKDSFYIFELIGLKVYEGGHYWGKVCRVLQPGANDVYVVQTPDNKEIYLPALKTVILKVDLTKKRMEVKIPPGLIGEESK